jgi:hypothetical protein
VAEGVPAVLEPGTGPETFDAGPGVIGVGR